MYLGGSGGGCELLPADIFEVEAGTFEAETFETETFETENFETEADTLSGSGREEAPIGWALTDKGSSNLEVGLTGLEAASTGLEPSSSGLDVWSTGFEVRSTGFNSWVVSEWILLISAWKWES